MWVSWDAKWDIRSGKSKTEFWPEISPNVRMPCWAHSCEMNGSSLVNKLVLCQIWECVCHFNLKPIYFCRSTTVCIIYDTNGPNCSTSYVWVKRKPYPEVLRDEPAPVLTSSKVKLILHQTSILGIVMQTPNDTTWSLGKPTHPEVGPVINHLMWGFFPFQRNLLSF